MVFAVLGEMGFTNATRRDNAHNFVTNRLSLENLWGPVVVTDTTLRRGTAPAILCEFRFTTEAARDSFWTDLLAQLVGVQGPVVGSWVERHSCTHDGAAATCGTVERHVF